MKMPNDPVLAAGLVQEFTLCWPASGAASMMPGSNPHFDCCTATSGSTHELVYDQRGGGQVFWVSGQKYDHIAKVALDGTSTFYAMPEGSAPHGARFDHQGRLWVTFEGLGQLARIDGEGKVVETVDVKLHARDTRHALNTHPHGLGVGPDGALWFTGKLTNTVGRVDGQGKVEHFELPTFGAVPIYISAGADGNMWCTEVGANNIARVTPEGVVTEFAIPTVNSRPIAIVASPDGKAMWFTEEAGGKVGRIDFDGNITEFPIPFSSRTAILGGLAFDDLGRLWLQQYVSPPAAGSPVEDDYIIRVGAGLLQAAPGDLTGLDFAYYKAPTRGTVMHRITQGPDGAMWFTELGPNHVGRIAL